MIISFYPFMLIAALGFVLSLLIHLATWFGIELPPETIYLHFGIFVVGIPLALLSSWTRRGYRRHYGWKDSLAHCPTWMRWTVYSLFGYLFLNFILNLGVSPTTIHNTLRLASGLWLAYYGLAFATIYSALHTPTTHTPPQQK